MKIMEIDINQFATDYNPTDVKPDTFRSPMSVDVSDENGFLPPVRPERPQPQRRPQVLKRADDKVVAARKANMEKVGASVAAGARGRDLGSGRREFNPASMGIVDKYEEKPKTDEEKLYEILDTEVEKRHQEELDTIKNLAEELGRAPTEQEILEAQGKGYINDLLDNHPERVRTLALSSASVSEETLKKRQQERDAKYAEADAREEMNRALMAQGEDDDIEDGEVARPDSEENSEEYGEEVVESVSIVYDFEQAEEEVENIDLGVDEEPGGEDYDAIAASIHLPGMEDDSEHEFITDASQLFANGSIREDEEETEMAEEFNSTTDEIEEMEVEEESVESEDYLTDYEEPDEEEAPRPRRRGRKFELSEERQKEIEEAYKEEVRSRLRPAVKKFDISSFTVAGHTSISKSKPVKRVRRAVWPLFFAKRPIEVASLTATELDELYNGIQTAESRYMAQKRKYQILFDHVLSPKPKTVEEWMKTIPHKDKENLWFAWYIANFQGANYIASNCEDEKCGRVFLSEDIPVLKMVKYKDVAAGKALYTDIVNMTKEEQKFVSGIWVSERVQVSDKYAIEFKEPSLYDTILEPSLVADDGDYYQKHQNAIIRSIFIKQIYEIDYENEKLVPIDFTVYPGKTTKTYKARIHMIEQILSTFSSAEMAIVQMCCDLLETSVNIDTLSQLLNANSEEYKNRETVESITYVVPEAVCPDCGKTVPEKPISSTEAAVFTRHQLATQAI